MRIFKPKKDLKYLKSILPKFKLARVTKILGATSLILTDLDSGKSLSRNLADVYKVSHGLSYGNLYGDTLKANMEEIRETYHDLSFTKLPILDGRGKARLLREEGIENGGNDGCERKNDDEAAKKETKRHQMVLRPRKSLQK